MFVCVCVCVCFVSIDRKIGESVLCAGVACTAYVVRPRGFPRLFCSLLPSFLLL